MMYLKLKTFFTNRIIVVLAVLWIILNLLMRYGTSGTNSISEISGSNKIPDLLFGYSARSLQILLENFGALGRANYLNFQFYDFIYPLIYSSLLLGIFVRINSIRSINFWILMPWIGAIADYLENIFLRIIIIGFPDMNAKLVDISSTFTIIKWLIAYLTIAIIILLLLKRTYYWSRQKFGTSLMAKK